MDDLLYLDNAATSFPKPEAVYAFMDQFYRRFGVNPGRSGFDLCVEAEEPCKVRLELGVSYRKARGNLSRKIFQIGEATYKPGRRTVRRRHSFQDRSTRKHYPGEHQLSILVNGVEKARTSFHLQAPPP